MQELCWVRACIGSEVAFETMNIYMDEVSERKVKVN